MRQVPSPVSTSDAVAADLVELLDLDGCRYEPFPFDVQLPRIESGSILIAAAEPGVAPWRAGTGIELPVRFDGLTLGRFVLVPKRETCGVAFPAQLRATAIAIVTRAAPGIAESLLDDRLADR
jgi:hypothetical protein